MHSVDVVIFGRASFEAATTWNSSFELDELGTDTTNRTHSGGVVVFTFGRVSFDAATTWKLFFEVEELCTEFPSTNSDCDS